MRGARCAEPARDFTTSCGVAGPERVADVTDLATAAPEPASIRGGPARVLVTDGDTRVALACVRALVRRGHNVRVAATGRRCLAGASRFVAGAHAVGDASADPRGWAERLEQAATSMHADLLLPVTEVSLGSIYAFGIADRWPVACPERAVYEAVVDKHAFLEQAVVLWDDTCRAPGSTKIGMWCIERFGEMDRLCCSPLRSRRTDGSKLRG